MHDCVFRISAYSRCVCPYLFCSLMPPKRRPSLSALQEMFVKRGWNSILSVARRRQQKISFAQNEISPLN